MSTTSPLFSVAAFVAQRLKKGFLVVLSSIALRHAFFWLTEALIEGFIINIPLAVFLHLPFTFFTVIAYGIVVRKTLEYLSDIMAAVRKPIGHTSNAVPPKDKRD